jgi:3-oxoacyl-[acyl-carrier-protein] synthase III
MKQAQARSCFIRGIGRSVCGVDGVQGLLVDHKIGMQWLVENGTFNPATGGPLTMDWAERNLGCGTISVGFLEPMAARLGIALPQGSSSATEWQLIDPAVRTALREAEVPFEQADCIILVSPTVSLPRTATRNIGFQDCLREFQARYPIRSDCMLFHLQNGCSGVVPAFILAKSLLTSGQCDTVLIVTSVWAGIYRDAFHAARHNDINVWISGLLFGDAAAALVLTASSEGIRRGVRFIEVERTLQYTDSNLWIAKVNSDPENGDYISINTGAAKALFIEKFREVLGRANVSIDMFDRIIIHQPNSDIVKQINRQYQAQLRTPILDIANRYGNLVCSSAVVNLYEMLSDENAPSIPHGGRMFLFTLGADAGMTYGSAILRHHIA